MHVVIAHPLFRPFEARLREGLGPGCSLRFVDPAEVDDPVNRYLDAEVLVCQRFPADWGPRFPALRLLHAAGAGIDKIDVHALPAGARLCRTFGHGTSIAEYVLMVMLAFTRGLLPADQELRRDRWLSPQWNSSLPLAESLRGKTLVVLGTGEIGSALAEMGRSFGLQCVGVNRSGRMPAAGGFVRTWPISSLAEVLPAADFLVVALPLADETRGLLGREALAALKPTAYLVNVARGPVVDEAALFDALVRRSFAGAALDVWYNYPSPGSDRAPPSRFRFQDLGHVIMTPHLSGVSQATFQHRAGDVVHNVRALMAGQPLRNEVHPLPRADPRTGSQS